ncbi:hypothetical protein [Hymenobacter ruber]
MAQTLTLDCSNGEILDFIDQWVFLLAQEKYDEAMAFMEAEPYWTADLIREIITENGSSSDRVTLHNNGTSVDGTGKVWPTTQRKEVEWYSEERSKAEEINWFDENKGDVWYDLNINGLVSDLTATFDLEKRDGRIHVILQDIHVM